MSFIVINGGISEIRQYPKGARNRAVACALGMDERNIGLTYFVRGV